MTPEARKAQQQRTYLLAIGTMIFQHGQALPKSIYRALEKRGKEIGIDMKRDIENPPTCRE